VAGMLLDPQREERMGHMLVALACLVLTGASIVMSMIYMGLPQFVMQIMRLRAAQ